MYGFSMSRANLLFNSHTYGEKSRNNFICEPIFASNIIVQILPWKKLSNYMTTPTNAYWKIFKSQSYHTYTPKQNFISFESAEENKCRNTKIAADFQWKIRMFTLFGITKMAHHQLCQKKMKGRQILRFTSFFWCVCVCATLGYF